MLVSKILFALIFIISIHYAASDCNDCGVCAKATKKENDVSRRMCKKDQKYRSINGTCNNLCNERCPLLGATGTEYTRYMKNSYCDGKEELPCTCSGDSLPSARATSTALLDEKKKLDDEITLAGVAFGQYFVHDCASRVVGAGVTCCANGTFTPEQETHPKCDAIEIPKDDPVFGNASIKCFNFVRSDTSDCKPAVPRNGVSSFIDLSQMYGSDLPTMTNVRAFEGGMMQSKKKNGKEWLPQSANPAATCFNITSPDEACYRAGDPRVNQNPPLTCMHTIFLRYHNHLAKKLCGNKNCTWGDEKCFQETRRICIAVFQHICYNEYLPCIIGLDYMLKYKLIYNETCRDKDGYVNDYSCDCDPSMSVECASAALRGQHSAIPGQFKLYFEKENYKHKNGCHSDPFNVTGSIELNDWINKPSVIEMGNNSIGLSRGLFAQRQEGVDKHVDPEIHHRLFSFGRKLGIDLLAIDMERARDHGVVTYCNAAIACGILTKCDCFDDLLECMPKKHVKKLKKWYADPKDVELFVGGMLERHECGARTGPVFRCIIGKQFKNCRCGDRFWYENKHQPYPFTPAQLASIRTVSMGSIICQHGDGIERIQKNPFKKICKKNCLVNCCDLPTLDYSLFECTK